MVPEFYHLLHKSPLSVSILSQTNIVHDIPPYFFKIILILSSPVCPDLIFHVVSSLKVFPPNPCTHVSSPTLRATRSLSILHAFLYYNTINYSLRAPFNKLSYTNQPKAKYVNVSTSNKLAS